MTNFKGDKKHMTRSTIVNETVIKEEKMQQIKEEIKCTLD